MSVIITGTMFWADWPHASDTTLEVRAKSDKAWVADDLSIVPAQKTRVVGTGSIAALRPTLPNITLPATSAGLDNQTSKWTVTLHRTGRKDVVHTVLADFPLPSSFEPSVTWAQISINKNGHQPLRDTSVYTKIETNHQIDLKAGTLNDATDVSKGRVRLSAPATLVSDPVAVSPADLEYPASFAPIPSVWGRRKDTSNPIFVTSSGDRQFENYSPSMVRIGSTTYIYTKGTTQIHAYSRTDAGVVTYLGVALSPGSSGAWDDENVVEPQTFYDPVASVIHLWYKGYNGTSWAWGHATAPAATPATLTKDAANPIKTAAQVATGMSLGTVTDTAISEVIKIGSTYHFYFYATDGTTWKVGRATATTWNNPTIVGEVSGFPASTNRIRVLQSIFKPANSNYYVGLFVEGANTIDSNPESWRAIFVATSFDGLAWTRIDPGGMCIQPTGGTSGWEARMTHAVEILKDPTDATNLVPLMLGTEFQFYYSAIDSTGLLSQAGIMYATPGVGATPGLSIPAAESSIPAIRFYNTAGSKADAAISTLDDSTGVDLLIGSNLFRSASGSAPRYDIDRAASGVFIKRGGSLEFFRWEGGAAKPLWSPLHLTTSGAIFTGAGAAGSFNPARIVLNNSTWGNGVAQFFNDTGTWSLAEVTGSAATRMSIAVSGTANAPIDFNQGSSNFTISGSGAVIATGNIGAGVAPNLFGYPTSKVLTVGGQTLGIIEIAGNAPADGNVSLLNFYNQAASGGRLASFVANRSGANNSGQLSLIMFNAGTPVEALRVSPAGKVTIIGADAVVGNGVPALVARVGLTGQTASIAATTIYTPAAAGLYEITMYYSVTTAGSAGTLTGAIRWTDADSSVALNNGGFTAISLASQTVTSGSVMVRAKAATAIEYLTTVSGAAGSPQYNLYIVVKKLE